MSWDESAFGRDDGVICDATYSTGLGMSHPPCGKKTWVTDDQGHGYVSYECEQGHQFAIQYEYEPNEHAPDCSCSDCGDNAVFEAIRDEEMYGTA